ncbi:MAG: hypothetical protein QOE70_6466 [Chthoniobacter sp.]|jgi:hypothetical protein|nr:hypothetical protein [Chthoniobacter sp.]
MEIPMIKRLEAAPSDREGAFLKTSPGDPRRAEAWLDRRPRHFNLVRGGQLVGSPAGIRKELDPNQKRPASAVSLSRVAGVASPASR